MCTSARCKTPGRNICAPNGVAALFIDVDGTIMKCEPYFEEAEERFAHLMGLLGFDTDRSVTVLREINLEISKTLGFERDRYPRSVASSYRILCAESDMVEEPAIIGICNDIGNSPFFREPELFDNVGSVLGRAQHNFLIIAVTIGNREVQKYKIRKGGLDAIFDDIIITPNDDKLKCVREAIEDMNIDPRFSGFVGNSLRSDGSCLEATNFCYLPLETGWSFQQSELPASQYDVFKASDWRGVEERAIKRLLRRREQLPG